MFRITVLNSECAVCRNSGLQIKNDGCYSGQSKALHFFLIFNFPVCSHHLFLCLVCNPLTILCCHVTFFCFSFSSYFLIIFIVFIVVILNCRHLKSHHSYLLLLLCSHITFSWSYVLILPSLFSCSLTTLLPKVNLSLRIKKILFYHYQLLVILFVIIKHDDCYYYRCFICWNCLTETDIISKADGCNEVFNVDPVKRDIDLGTRWGQRRSTEVNTSSKRIKALRQVNCNCN